MESKCSFSCHKTSTPVYMSDKIQFIFVVTGVEEYVGEDVEVADITQFSNSSNHK